MTLGSTNNHIEVTGMTLYGHVFCCPGDTVSVKMAILPLRFLFNEFGKRSRPSVRVSGHEFIVYTRHLDMIVRTAESHAR
eukprot:2019235-Pleurochrysis_carterae.AAC.1